MQTHPYTTPQPETFGPGRDDKGEICALLARVVRDSDIPRHEFARETSLITGERVTDAMLKDWCALSRETRNLPLWLAPAVEKIGRSRALSEWLAKKGGGRLLWGAEALTAELGRLERQRDATTRRIETLKERMENYGK